MVPIATTVAGDEPDKAAKSIQAKTPAMARPPGKCPTIAIENLIIDPINNDQIWGMKFYNNNAEAVYVTVNSDIAVNTSENWWSKNGPIFALNAEPYTVDNGVLTGISDGDNLSGAGDLTLDGSFVSGGTAAMPGNYKQVSRYVHPTGGLLQPRTYLRDPPAVATGS